MRQQASAQSEPLPDIPSKRYFAIGEVSELCAVKPHVLRYWEQEFPQLRPVKRRGNRRYYQAEDVQMVRQIRSLLYEQGFTIGGARQRLKESPRTTAVVTASRTIATFPVPHPVMSPAAPAPRAPGPKLKPSKAELARMRSDLEAALKLLEH